MANRSARGSIERRFVVSILWVGVIPMGIALIIGYLAARETQQIVVLENLSTSARKTADGIRLALDERLKTAVRIANTPEIRGYLRMHEEAPHSQSGTVGALLREEAMLSGERDSSFALYGRNGEKLLESGHGEMLPPVMPAKGAAPTAPTYMDLGYSIATNRYLAVLAVPIPDVEGELLGYLVESQGVRELLQFILDEPDRRRAGFFTKGDRYEILLSIGDEKRVVYPDVKSSQELPPPKFEEMDSRLAARLDRHPQPDSDAMFFWNYPSRGRRMPVLLAYHRLMPSAQVFISVHRPTPQIFSVINLAAAVTLVTSGLIIAVFCLIAYRIVNKTIIQPVSLLNEGAQIIRQGDLDLKLRINSGNEIEELAASFNQMAQALRHNLRQLRDSEEQHRTLVNSMRDGLFRTDREGRFTFINPAGVAILGFHDTEEALGGNFAELFEDREISARIFSLSSGPGVVDNTRVWLRPPERAPICVDLRGQRLTNTYGVLEGVEGTFRDVTAAVRLEEAATERAGRIAVINQIANAVNSSLEAGRVYGCITVELRKLIDFDYAAVSLRLEKSDLFETRQLWPEPREGREQFPRLDSTSSCAAWVASEGRTLMIDDVRASNSVFAYQFPERVHSILCAPLHADGKIIGTLNLGAWEAGEFDNHDTQVLHQLGPHLAAALRNAQLLENLKQSLEEVTRAREKLHEVNEELKSLDEMKTNLLSNVSHELRTPLVAVMGYTDMVLNGKAGPVTDAQREYLGISLRNVEKLVTLIENLLDFSRLHRGAEEVVFTRFDLLECVNACLDSVRLVAESKSLTLSLVSRDESGAELPPPVYVEGDKGKLGQVFTNLLSNAVKFNEPGGSITVSVEKRKDTLYIAVADTGIGIPEEALDKVFTRFYQVDSSSTRKYGGTGIGLAIAQDIVRLHGSRITVSSRPGEGATFRFSLPCWSGAAESREMMRDMPLPIETHQLVELVTQDRALATHVRNLLLEEGMDVLHAPYPAVAATLAGRHNPDCVLVDTEAEPLGSLVVEEIINEQGMAGIPVVLLTNDDALMDRYQNLVAGRVRRNFRKSTLLGGIHSALSSGTPVTAELGPKILCVDDDAEIGKFILCCLENEGYTGDYCASGEEALELAESGEYWMVLLDIAMPGIDGWAACRALKSNSRLAGIKVHIVTAKPVDAQMPELRDCGADGYLLKPFKSEDLLAVVRTFDANRRRG